VEVQVHLEIGILFAEFGVTIPQGQYTMKMICDSVFVKLTKRELYDIAKIDLVNH
jgi:hypothetical protein